jgi:NitT/TauT family transport system substrate-binding protein
MVSPSYFPAIAAVELGFFRQEGLDATIELLFPVTTLFEALRDGTLDYAGGAAHALLYAFPQWKGCRLLCALSQNMYWFLVLAKAIGAKRGDLGAVRGLRIGAAPGPVDGLKGMLLDAGIDPDREVALAPVPGAAGLSFGLAAAKALEEGRIDGFWANGMGAEVAVRGGFGALILDARRGDGPAQARHYTFAAFATTQKRIEEQPAQVAAAARAIAAAQAALKRDPTLATQAAARLFPPAELALIAELVRRDAPFYQPAISARSVEALNAFARRMGLLSDSPPYEQVVSPQLPRPLV